MMLAETKISQPKVVAYPYQRKPVIPKAEDDSVEEKLLFQKERNKVETPSLLPKALVNISSTHKPKESEVKVIEVDIDLENNLSTSGQEMYIVDGRDITNDYKESPMPIPAWSELGVIEGDEDEEPTNDQDLDWLLTAKVLDYKSYYRSSFQDSSDVLLNQLSDNYRHSPPMPEMKMNEPAPSQPISDPKDSESPIKPDLKINTTDHAIKNRTPSPKSGRVSPKAGSPRSQKFYSWYQYRSPPRSGSPKEQEKRRKQREAENKREKPKERERSKSPVEMVVSKSMPALPSAKNIGSVASLEGSSAAETKRSLQGLTHMVFEGNSTDSPYVEHLVKPNKALEVLQNPLLANRSDLKGINRESSSPKASKRPKRPSSSGNANTKNYAIIKDELDKTRLFSQTFGARIAQTKTRFPPIKVKQSKYNTNSLLEMVYERPDDLYVKSKIMAEQLATNRSQARLSNKQGLSFVPVRALSPGQDKATGRLYENINGVNFMNSQPTSPELIRSISPGAEITGGYLDTSMLTNNIDQLITTMALSKPSISSSRPKLSRQLPPPEVNESEWNGNAGDPTEEAVEMLNNIHVDPLYRIIRDEIETIKAQFAGKSRTSLSTSSLPNSNGLGVARFGISPKNIKILSNFHSLPPAAWVVCRITYFLVMAYYESVIRKPDYVEYRKVSQLENMWTILERHSTQENLNTLTISKIFSWPYLQELMAFPTQFTKLLDCVENGVQLSAIQWKLFSETVRKQLFQLMKNQRTHVPDPSVDEANRQAEQVGGAGSTERLESEGVHDPMDAIGIAYPQPSHSLDGIPIEMITNNEKSRNLFYDLFPIPALQPLRELVKAAKVFLLGNSSSLYHSDNQAPGSSNPAVPGSPLAITLTMTSWVKRVIALIYISTTQRLKELRINSPIQGMINESLFHAQDGGESPQQLSPTIITPQAGEVGNRSAMQPNPKILHTSHFQSRLSCLLVLHHPQRFASPFSMQQKAASFDEYQSNSPATVLRGVPAYFQIATGLVKPSDDFNVLIMKPVNPHSPSKQNEQQQNNSVDEYQIMLKDVQKHLRITSGSPLHTVQILPMENYYLLKQKVYTNSGQSESPNPLELTNKLELIDQCFILHDGLLYCLQINDLVLQKLTFFERSTMVEGSAAHDEASVPKPASPSHAEKQFLQQQLHQQGSKFSNRLTLAPNLSAGLNEKRLDFFVTEFKIGQKNQPLLKVRKYTNFSADIYEAAESVLKEKLTFSLGLISDSMSINSGHATRARGSNYAVCVNDSLNGWNAFEMARKLAKENDNLFLVYVPMISYWELYDMIRESQQQFEHSSQSFNPNHHTAHPSFQPGEIPPPSCSKLAANPFITKSSLTYQQYLLLVDRVNRKVENLQSIYRHYGFNVLVAEMPSYVEVLKRLMNNYSIMMRYNTELYQQQQSSPVANETPEDSRLSYEKFVFYQYNEEVKHYTRRLLLLLSPYEIDYIVTGADCHDIYHSLGNFYENSFFNFEAFPIRDFSYQVKVSTVYHPAEPLPSQSKAPSFDEGLPPMEVHAAAGNVISAYNTRDEFSPKGQAGHRENYLFPSGPSENNLLEKSQTTAGEEGIFEQRATILSSTDPADNAVAKRSVNEAENPEPEDEQYDEEWSLQSKSRNPAPNKPDQQQIVSDQKDPNSEYDLDSFIMEDNDEGNDSLTASPIMIDQHHIAHAYEMQREQLQHSSPKFSAPYYEEKKEFVAKKPLFSKKHLKYYQQYSEKPIEFIDMLLHQALIIDQWADEGQQSIAESVISPTLSVNQSSAFSPRQGNGTGSDKPPQAFFSFILANGSPRPPASAVAAADV